MCYFTIADLSVTNFIYLKLLVYKVLSIPAYQIEAAGGLWGSKKSVAIGVF
jgi:hypothetical protein